VSGDFWGFVGPGGPKLDATDADWVLIAADMSALPVAAASLEAMPSGARGVAIFEVTTAEDRQFIDAPLGVEQHWFVHGDPHHPSTALPAFVAGLDWPEGRVKTMIAGESSVIRALRLHVRGERAVDRQDAYVSGYWKIGLREDQHRTAKADEAKADERTLASVSV